MRRETIRMTKNMSPLVLNDMIGTMLSKSLRKYALTLEFFSHKYGVLSLQNPRIAMIYENMLDTDAWWHLFVSKLIYLCYSPTSPFFNVCSFYLLQLLIFNNFFFFHFFFFFIFLRFFAFNLFIQFKLRTLKKLNKLKVTRLRVRRSSRRMAEFQFCIRRN